MPRIEPITAHASNSDVKELRAEVARIKQAIVLLAAHVRGYSWDSHLREILDEFRNETRS